MKLLKYAVVILLSFAVAVTALANSQNKKDKKEKKEKVRVVWVSGIVTGVDGNPLDLVAMIVWQNGLFGGSATGEDGRYSLSCNSNDTMYVEKKGYVTKIIPINGREEIDVILEKIPENLLPAQDTTRRK